MGKKRDLNENITPKKNEIEKSPVNKHREKEL